MGNQCWAADVTRQVTRAIAEGDTIGREVEDNAKARRLSVFSREPGGRFMVVVGNHFSFLLVVV